MGNLNSSGLLVVCLISLVLTACQADTDYQSQVYYISSLNGSDLNSGTVPGEAWESIDRLYRQELYPGDTVKFEYGSEFKGLLKIKYSGDSLKYLVLTSYNSNSDQRPPSFTNSLFDPEAGEFGNCIRLQGSYIIVDDLYFHGTVAELKGRIGFETMWELGAVYIDKEAQNCIIRNNEFFDCGVGIKSYGKNALITNNYIHDCNRILKEWSWGPLAIWLGGDYQEVCYNRIINYKAIDPRINWGPDSYGGGADGGAIEIDDARYPKSNISIHHNYSSDNQGFIEVTWTDVKQNPPYRDFRINHNFSDDYQQFIALWCGSDCKIDNNTILRRKRNVNDWGVFNITQYNSRNYIRNNIIVVDNDIVVFNVGMNKDAEPNSIINNNLFYSLSGELNIGFEGYGESYIIADPQFVNIDYTAYESGLKLLDTSPCINSAIKLEYDTTVSISGTSYFFSNNIGAF